MCTQCRQKVRNTILLAFDDLVPLFWNADWTQRVCGSYLVSEWMDGKSDRTAFGVEKWLHAISAKGLVCLCYGVHSTADSIPSRVNQPNWNSRGIEMFPLNQIMCHLPYMTWCQNMLPWWAWHFICVHISSSQCLIWKCNPTKTAFVWVYLADLFE